MPDNQEDNSVEKEFKFSGNPARNEGETYEEYKARRKLIKQVDKQRLKGKHVWPSKLMGTFYKEFKGQEEAMVKHTMDYIKAAQEQSLKDKNND
jgi:hypothetical protein